MLYRWFRQKLLAKEGRRLPLKHPPLRVPAQGLREDYEERLEDVVTWGIMTVVAFLAIIVLAVYLAVVIYLNYDNSTKFVLQAFVHFGIPVATAIIPYVFISNRRKHKTAELRDLYLGMIAETYVGQQLERSRKFGCSVFHDIVEKSGDRKFNIDHVVIGRFGIAAIETKARSKPLKGETNLWAVNDKIHFMDGTYSKEPITQAKSNERWIRDIVFDLLSETGNPAFQFRRKEEIPVRTIICYPGWYVDYKKTNCNSIYVTNDELLLRYLHKRDPVWGQREVNLMAELFGKYLRNKCRGLLLAD